VETAGGGGGGGNKEGGKCPGEVFLARQCDTYKRATLEFLATFHDDLAILGRRTTVSFSLNNTLHCLTFDEFCGCFGFSTTGELDINY
jgi:hypothetical protein